MEKETVLATLWKHKTRRSREASDFAPDSNPDDDEQSGGQGAEGQAGDQWPLRAAGPRPRGSERWGTAAESGERDGRQPERGAAIQAPACPPPTQKLPICLTHGSLTWGER